ncbi:MAG: recombinase family protein, partial [Anaerolineae bacterium]|nr:recombinase family protein [Anaerolineae bacterium]
MSARSKRKSRHARIALCYIRQSYARDEDDVNSPERQRANIQTLCERNGWIPEWYEDVGGHKSGRSEKNRPQWLALKARIGDTDVVALVANDMARLHRKGWRVGDLVEYLDEHDVALALAAPGREMIDTSTPQGRMFLQFGAIIDEYYAEDISQRAKDSVLYRKARGQTIGMPPFGTIRGDDGYLHPSSEGAWLLSDGQFVVGDPDQAPGDDAIWRAYYECAHYILRLYVEGDNGLERIAYQLNQEGWPFRDRTGVPRPISRDDVRRVVANWPEYGGIVMDRKAKERPAYKKYDVAELPFKEERAVFPIKLLKAVAQVRQERTIRPTNDGVNRKSHPYPLAGITYCAHCVGLAEKHNNPKLRSRLGGSDTYGTLRYKHKLGVKCGCRNRSVRREIYEDDFGRLIKLLTVKPEALDLMMELAIQADKVSSQYDSDVDLEVQKQEAITLCRKRIDAAVVLFGDGRISAEEYRRRVDANEREIAHWEARTTETEKQALELGMCMEAVERISRLWNLADDEDRQGLVRSLFEYLVYDLDTRRIVDFRLKPWADRFLTLRAALYADKDEGSGDEDDFETHRRHDQAIARKSEAGYEVTAPMGHKCTVRDLITITAVSLQCEI